MSFLISKFEYDYLSERKRTHRHARGERVWRRGDGAHHGICVVVVVVSSTSSIVLALDDHYHPRERQWHIIHSMKTTLLIIIIIIIIVALATTEARSLADRSRVVKARNTGTNRDHGKPIAGPAYRVERADLYDQALQRATKNNNNNKQQQKPVQHKAPWQMDIPKLGNDENENEKMSLSSLSREEHRKLSSQLTGCCYNYQSYSASEMCYTYGQDCESGETPSHDDDNDGDCSHDGLSFIGLSFSVNTANGNPYSYQLCDQFPMENIIDRKYEYIMSMDEDGWLVGGGYKTFDYSGKMPYIDSSHTEILRIGNLDPNTGGTTMQQVYTAMAEITFPPLPIYPEYLKGGGGHHSGDGDGQEGSPSGDVTLIVSIVETYDDDNSYSGYEKFINDLFDAMYEVGGGPCMDDDDTDPHVSMSRGVKFWSSNHMQQYMYNANLEVAVWQSMYPNGVVIGSNGYASFPPGFGGTRQYVGYGNLYFFFDRANITKAFAPNRDLTDNEKYYATLFTTTDVSTFYSKTTSIGFDYSGSQDNGNYWEHNPYSWHSSMAIHDMTDGWELPPNCLEEGETFFGIPLSRSSSSKLQSTSTFQEQFDFEYLTDRNNTYVSAFGTNHGWLVGEAIGNAVGSIVDKDTAHIALFYTGTTSAYMGGMSLGDMIKVANKIDFGTLYIKPAFVFVDSFGHVQLQFEADSSSALGYLYDNLCKELGIAWNYETPSNEVGLYTNCAMHAAGDRATYGCGPDNSNSGGFCPRMTIAYSPRFMSEDHAAAYLDRCNNYVDYWRSLYPSGVAVGTSKFCSDGGCLGLFLNRYDLYEVFKPDLGGSWVEYNGASMPPTYSPAPTWKGGCDEPHNFHLDKCFRKRYKPKASAVAWDALGSVGQFSVMLIVFMAVTLSVSIFLARARKKKRRGESYIGFFFRDLTRKSKGKKKRRGDRGDALLNDGASRGSRRSKRSRSKSRSKGGSRSGSRSKSRSGRSRSSSRRSSRPRSMRAEQLQPHAASSGGASVVSAGSGSQRSGVFNVAVTTPQDDTNDNRQQLV